MKCHDFDRWLEDGALDSLPDAVRAHAESCARCAARLRAADDLELALTRAVTPVPDGFVHQVMARVAETRQVRVPLAEVLPLLQPLPWWVRVARDPAAILATLVVALLLWQGDAMATLVGSGAAQLVAWLAQHAPVAQAAAPASMWLQPAVLTAIAIAVALLALLSWRPLFDWSAHLVGPRLRPRIH